MNDRQGKAAGLAAGNQALPSAADIINRPVEAIGIRYFIKLHPDRQHAAIYRIYSYVDKSARFGTSGDYWDWKTEKWVFDEDIIRRYRTGFDADVDSASEIDVINLIRSFRRYRKKRNIPL